MTPNDSDLAVLKTEALQAEIEGDLKLAETIWTRLLRFDQDQALQSLYRIRDKLKEKSSTPTISDETEILNKKSVATVNPQPEAKHQNINNNLLPTEPENLPPKPAQVVENARSKEEPNLNKPSGETRRSKRFQLPQISWPELPSMSRRQLLKSMGWTGTGIVTITVGKWLLDTIPPSPTGDETIKPDSKSSQNPIESPLPSNKTEKKGESQFEFQFVTVNEKGEELKRETSTAKYISEDLGNNVTLDMVSIPGGSFLRGTDDAEIERLVKKFDWDGFRRERPQKKVTVPAFSMSKYPITQKQWRAIASDTSLKVERDLNPDPSSFKDSHEGQDRLSRPVETVSWQDAMEFCARLSLKTGQNYRLPTEAEWEYACRAGTTTPFHFGETIRGDLANYRATQTYADEPKGQYRQQTTPVGYFKVANPFGLYDMHGNVWEWCLDPWHGDYNGAPTDGSVWDEENQQEDYYQDIVKNLKKLLTDDRYHVLRGGSWYINPIICRCAYRYNDYARVSYINVGFRVVSGPPRT
ncbi:MAG: formylglycine-generating enzyme family protein [Crocosphaera sp.]